MTIRIWLKYQVISIIILIFLLLLPVLQLVEMKDYHFSAVLQSSSCVSGVGRVSVTE